MLTTRKYRACTKSFAHIKNLLEGYDNLAIMTILSGSGGLFELKFDNSMTEEFLTVLEKISEEFDLEEL